MLADSLKLLRHIDLACCMNLSALSFLELLKLPKLHHVGLRATNVSDYVVSNLVLTLEGLLHLDVSYCPRVSNNALVNLGQMLKCKTMPHQGAHVDSNPLVFKVMSSCVSLATASMGVFGTDAAWEPPDASLSGDGAAGGPRDAVDADSSKFMSFEDDYSDDDGGDEALAKLRPASVSVGRAASDMADGTDEFVGVRFRLQTLLMKAVNVNYITLAYIARFFPDLRRLDLSASRHLNTLPFRALALSCTSLEALEFRGCTRVDDESLVYIFSSASRYTLKHLNLRGCSRLTDKAFSYMFNNCAQLSSLNIVDCGRISDMSVTKLTGLLLLTRLEIGSSSSAPSHVNPDVTPRAVNQWLNGRACGYQLVVLRLFSTAVDDLVLSVISQRCHKLRELYVQDMPAVVKQRVVKDIVWEGVVEDRKCVTSRGLYHLAFGVCTSLTRLQLSCCDAIDTEGIMFLSDHPPPRLVDVQFTNCKGVGLRALQTIGASGFGQRQLKRLSMCDDPCSTVLEGLRAVMASSFSLELLEVRNCKLVPALENPATQAMLRSLPRLPPSLEWYPLLPSVSVTTDFE